MLGYYVGLLAVAVFSVTGALAAWERDVSFFALPVLGMTTVIGGGALRDAILNQPVFRVENLAYVRVAAATATLTFLVRRYRRRTHRMFMRTGRLLH